MSDLRQSRGAVPSGVRLNRWGPGRFRNGGRVFVGRPLDVSPDDKIKFKLGGTFQIFNPTNGVCVEPHGGAPRPTVGLLR
jgi:hypothetical protein